MKLSGVFFSLCALGGALIPASSWAQTPATGEVFFPFVIPWDDASLNAVSVAALNPAPLGAQHRVVARDGHFYDGTGRRVRFLGCNFTFGANFPEKADAEKVAARLHKYGFNVVRLHHMDYYKAPRGIFDPNYPDMQHIDAGQLDRLDYLVAQLKKHGIYVNLNLHVARAVTEADGFPDTDKLPTHDKVVTWFEPRMVAMQKDYARQILDHRNPYTGLRWADDPAVAFVEINNEDTLLGAAQEGALEKLPPYYRDQIAARWNGWLKRKYGTTAQMVAAWNRQSQPLGNNTLKNGQFTNNTQNWRLEQQVETRASLTTEEVPANTGPAGRALRATVTNVDATDWHVQLHQIVPVLPKGTYTLSFWAKSDVPRTLQVNSGMDIPPWSRTGLAKSFSVGTTWKRYQTIFNLTESVPDHNRLSFILGNATGELQLADVSLQPGFSFDVEPSQSLEQANIAMPPVTATSPGVDFTSFLMEVERDYVNELTSVVKKDLGSKALVTCSQASYGGLGGIWREAQTDFVDMHAYWQHPKFPRRSWDPKDWLIPNISMVADEAGGTLSNLAMHRVAGKPFTVSEYNHPAPNDFSAEGLPMLAAYAAAQDWDGIYLFEYNGSRDNWSLDRIKSFFSIDSHPGKMAFMPAAAALFLRGDLNPAARPLQTAMVPKAQIQNLAATYSRPWGGGVNDFWKNLNITKTDSLNSRLAIQFVENGATPQLQTSQKPPTNLLPTGVNWQNTPTNQALFTVTTPKSKALVGFLGGRTASAGELQVTMPPTSNNFATLMLTARSGASTHDATAMLLTVAGKVENQNMGWNADRTSVGDQWGKGPTQAEGIAARISLATSLKSAKVWALDGSGNRRVEVPCQISQGRLHFETNAKYQTLWYEIAGT